MFEKGNRNISALHEDFIMNCTNANVGVSRSYKLYKEFAGSYNNVGATVRDFRNFKRGL